ncbi:MAG: FAD-dependent thymidylate synthase [Acidilobaceae archaeon]
MRGLGVSVKLVSFTAQGERLVAGAARASLSRKPVDELFALSEDEVGEWILETFRRQHFSPWEHSVYTFVVDGLSRVASHQLVRHRLASYTQQSHRYTDGYLRAAALRAAELVGASCRSGPDAPKTETYRCYARALRELADRGGLEAVETAEVAYVKPPALAGEDAETWARSVLLATAVYYELLSRGVRMEDARYAVPNSVRTRIVVTVNARELVQVLLPLRMCTKTQWELRHIAWLMWRELSKVHPRLFKWAGPRCILAENSVRREPITVAEAMRCRDCLTIPRCPELVDREAIPLCLRQAVETAQLPGDLLEELLPD